MCVKMNGKLAEKNLSVYGFQTFIINEMKLLIVPQDSWAKSQILGKINFRAGHPNLLLAQGVLESSSYHSLLQVVIYNNYNNM